MAPIVEDKYQLHDRMWLECMERIGRKETAYFEQNNIDYTNQIVELNCRRGIMVWVYNELKKHKKITPIENLELDVKKQMWSFIKEICAGKTEDQKRMVEVAKTFYTIEYFLNENRS